MTSLPDVSRGSIAARNERGADRGAQSGHTTGRETLLLRGASAADAVPYQRTGEVSDIVRGGKHAGCLRGQRGLRCHQRQNRGVGKPADAHGGTQPGGAAADVRPVRMHRSRVCLRYRRMPRPNCSQL